MHKKNTQNSTEIPHKYSRILIKLWCKGIPNVCIFLFFGPLVVSGHWIDFLMLSIAIQTTVYIRNEINAGDFANTINF